MPCASYSLLLPGLLACSLLLSAAPAASVDFQREIRPLLSDSCFHCHGPDAGTRMAGLRLDTKEGLFAERKGGKVIAPGDPKASLLLARITHEKAGLRMPPASSGKVLSPEQQEKIRLWIEQGAKWQEHWAFQPLQRPSAPAVSDSKWARNPIDSFILARLEAAKLLPAAEAERTALIRRVSLDLTGLPPKPADVRAFLKDTSADAYEKLVDRLLASPAYGEHRARYWLDAARYADTHGLHIDNYREMWPYRDWVIGAFNRNLPFDRFTVEQIAGDLLPGATDEQRIATGFNRCNVTTNEGGAIPEEIEAMYTKDRVETTSTVWLGLTTGCAACHDHKFDPITQKEFYSFGAFFRNTTQRPMDGNIADTPPVLVVPSERDRPHWERLTAQVSGVRKQLAALREASARRPGEWLPSLQAARLDGAVDRSDVLFSAGEPGELPAGIAKAKGPRPGITGIRFSAGKDLTLPSLPQPDADTPFTVAAWIYLPKSQEEGFTAASQIYRPAKSGKDGEDEDKGIRGWSLDIGSRIPSLKLMGDTTLSARGSNVRRLTPGEWAHVAFTYDGSRRPGGFALYINGRPDVAESESSQNLKGSIRADAPLRLGGDGKRYFPEGVVADFRMYRRVLSDEEVRVAAEWDRVKAAAEVPANQLSAEHTELLNLLYLTRLDKPYRTLAAKLASLEQERQAIRYRSPVTHVMHEDPSGAPMNHVLFRGQYDQPREKVLPAVPGVLPPMPASVQRNRLGLAQWLVDPANPLTARVTVNRFWQEIFGTGLVATSEDFGAQGEPPSHPELLDWLAVEFRESGWDVKKLMKLMVTSSTYRQAAVANGDKLKADPENRLLSRGPRYRMDGEMIRDAALASGGLLVDKIGGPSVKPYQPGNIWETVAMRGSNTRFYKQDHGENLYRRSLYTFWKRSAPPASMEVFNAPTREHCITRRERTNTPLQALVTLNDPQFVEAARHLAARAIQGGADEGERLDELTARVIARRYTERERSLVLASLKDYRDYFDRDPEKARKLLATGESKVDPKADPVELAAWTMLASAVLNSDEALNK